MHVNGNLSVAGLIKDLKVEQLATDPLDPVVSRVWFNTTDGSLKYFDGSEVQNIAKGGNLGDYLALDGTNAMVGELTLNSSDQSSSDPTTAVSKGYLSTVADTKQDNVTGAATSILVDDLAFNMIAITDGTGKIAATTSAKSTEVEHLAGVTANVQTQLDGKEATLGYVPVDKAGDSMTGNLNLSGFRVQGLGSPEGPTDAVRQVDLETAVLGLDFQADVLDRQTDDTLDPGETPAEGDRYIIGTPVALHTNFGTIAELGAGDIVQYDGTQFVIAYDVSEVGVGALVWNRNRSSFQFYNGAMWADFGGLSGVTAGTGLEKDGNNIQIDMGPGVASTNDDALGVDALLNGGIFLTEDGVNASTSIDAKVAVKADNATLENSESGLRAKASGLNETHLNATTLANGLQGGDGIKLSVQTPAQSGITVDETGVLVDRAELRNTFLGRDGAEAMTGELLLHSEDQSASTGVAAVSKGYLGTQITGVNDTITALTTRMENGYFVYSEQVTAAVSHVVTHNLGNKYVQVTVVDSSDEVIIPESITYTDDNSLSVTFTQAATCRVIVTGLKAVAPE